MRKIVLLLGFWLLSAGFSWRDLPKIADDDYLDQVLSVTKHTVPANDLEQEELDMFNRLQKDFPDVDATIYWQSCLDDNAFYNPDDHSIEICTEIEHIGEGTLLTVGHEFAHAIEDQRWSVASERDADEIGTLLMLKYGKHDAILEQVKWFDGMKEPGVRGEPHPSSDYRAWFFSAMELGYWNRVWWYRNLYLGLTLKWEYSLNYVF